MSERGIYIPAEVLTDILSLLPVKTLLRFKCVSKRWLALIDSPDFIKLHLSQSLKKNRNRNLLIGDTFSIHSADFDSLADDLATGVATKLNPPLEGYISALAYCNGLLFLSNTLEDNTSTSIIWNPLTREQQIIHFTPVQHPNGRFYVQIEAWFGFDSETNDYKVIRVALFCTNYENDDSFQSEVKVYSLKNKMWRDISSCPYFIRHLKVGGMFVGDALHWIAGTSPRLGTDNLIAAFDLRTEEWRLVPRPTFKVGNFFMNLAVLGESLCVFSNYFSDFVDIWVMKEYGVEESWTKICSVVQSTDICSFEYLKTIAYSKNGKQLLLGQDYFSLRGFDLEKKSVGKAVSLLGGPINFTSDIFMASLVKLNSTTTTSSSEVQIHQNKDQENTKQKTVKKSWCFKQVEDEIGIRNWRSHDLLIGN
ncbi:hypothetical protein ACH5RR_005978 [Cinchona calisaya]|uniref:F-box domain-containing protein n=1 Tax=Cinchona calisaya TaxID=153742 RepID=A0ABD3AMP0_9GENT